MTGVRTHTTIGEQKSSVPAGGMLQRACACGRPKGPSGECADCQRQRGPALQPKLRVNQPGDRYEQEADRVAEQVMRMPEPAAHPQENGGELVQEKPPGVTISPLVQRQEAPGEEDDEEMILQRQTDGSDHAGYTSPELASRIQSMRGGGQPLDEQTRAFMEPRFGHSFADVRTHHDGQAAQVARDAQARAFTLGNDVFFGADEYQPGSSTGNRLIAHELTHTMQQAAQCNKQQPALMRHIDPGLFGRGTDSVHNSQGQARVAALAVAIGLGPNHIIEHHPLAMRGLPHYHVKNLATGRNVFGHFFYQTRRRRRHYNERKQHERRKARERTRRDAERWMRETLPSWVLAILSAAAIALIIACFATGACEAAAIIGAAGAAAAALIIILLREAGVDVDGGESQVT